MNTQQPSEFPQDTWNSVTASAAEAAGWSSSLLTIAQAYAQAIGSAAVMIIHQGRLLASWGDIARPLNCHSIRKSLLSALYGIHLDEGRLRLESTLEELDIDDTEPRLTVQEKQATIRDLLQSRSGVYHEASYETEGAKEKRPPRGSHAPGTFWYYNNWDFNVLGTILERSVGHSVFEDFQNRVAVPLHMQDFQLEKQSYEMEPCSLYPAYVFRLSARDLARFGLLFLRRGNWQGHQLLPTSWIEACTTAYSHNEWGDGFGYMWWVANNVSIPIGLAKNVAPASPHGSSVEVKTENVKWKCNNDTLFPNLSLEEFVYAAKGYGGHFMAIFPARDLIVVHRAETERPNGTVIDPGDPGFVSSSQFGTLLALTLEACPHP